MNEILEAKQIVHGSVTGTKANGEGAGTPCEDAPASSAIAPALPSNAEHAFRRSTASPA